MLTLFLVTRLTPAYDRVNALSLTHVACPASHAFIILNVMLI